jgi:hypothetical protein
LSRLDELKKLQLTLEGFFERFINQESEQINILHSVDTLDEIARDSLKGRHINNRLGDWMARNRSLIDNRQLQRSAVSAVGNLLSEIRTGFDETDPESQKLAREIDIWRQKGLISGRKLILRRAPERGQPETAAEYLATLRKEAELLGFYIEEGRHILSILDDVIKSAAVKIDRMYLHLAGSIIFYLKANGYKMEPYVKKLKELEKQKGMVTTDVD